MKLQKKQKLTWGIVLGLLIVVLISIFFSFKEGLDNPIAAAVKCMDKGVKCDKDNACCEGLKCLGEECK
jgi:hypothetical protein